MVLPNSVPAIRNGWPLREMTSRRSESIRIVAGTYFPAAGPSPLPRVLSPFVLLALLRPTDVGALIVLVVLRMRRTEVVRS